MKKLFISALALTALLAVSCNKETNNAPAPSGTPISIRATLDDATRTTYANEQTFSWIAGDKISLKVIKDEDQSIDVITLTAEESGTSVTFSGTLPDGYTAASDAFYPKGTGSTYYSSDLALQRGDAFSEGIEGHLRTWGTITPDLSNPMGSIPLIGVRSAADDSFHFYTCTGILRFTVSNIPADTYFFQLDAPDGTALNGNFSYGDDCTLYMENVDTPWPQKYVYFTPEAEGETRDFYLPIPVGTVPAGSTISVTSSSRGKIEVATTAKDIEVVRNKVIRIPAVTVPDPPVEEWISIGTGKFIDNFVWPFANLTDYASVAFQQSSLDENHFRIAKPYPGANSDEWFVFDVTDPNKVKSDDYFVDIEVTASGKATFKPWVRNGHDYGYNYSDVLRWQDNGLPANIEIGPCYRGEEFSTASNPYDYEIGRDHQELAIEIVFPGCEPYAPVVLTGDVSDVVGSYTVEAYDYWISSDVTTSITIAASDNSSLGNIMITEFGGHEMGDPSSCAYTYGTYSSGSMVFPDPKNVTPFYIDGNGAGHVLANYFDEDLTFTVKEPGLFVSGVSYFGNHWATATGGGFDTLYTSYKAVRNN